MIYQISSDNMSLTESMKVLAQEKISKLERFFKDFPEDTITARVVLNAGSANDTYEVKLELNANGKVYFTQEVDYSLESSLVKVVDETERQLEKDRSENTKGWEKIREMKAPAEELEE